MKLKSLGSASLLAGLLAPISTLPAIAGTFDGIRNITSNNIYQCSTGLAWERTLVISNVFRSYGRFSMLCMNPDGSMRWILESEAGCDEETACPDNLDSYLQGDYDAFEGTYTRYLTNIEVRTNCQRQDREGGGWEWVCEDSRSYDSLTVETTGLSEIMSISSFSANVARPRTEIKRPLTKL